MHWSTTTAPPPSPGASLERQLGSLQLLWLMLLICLLGGVAYVAIAYLAAALLPASAPALLQFMSQCAVGLSGVIFGLVVVELSLSGAPTRRWVRSGGSGGAGAVAARDARQAGRAATGLGGVGCHWRQLPAAVLCSSADRRNEHHRCLRHVPPGKYSA